MLWHQVPWNHNAAFHELILFLAILSLELCRCFTFKIYSDVNERRVCLSGSNYLYLPQFFSIFVQGHKEVFCMWFFPLLLHTAVSFHRESNDMCFVIFRTVPELIIGCVNWQLQIYLLCCSLEGKNSLKDICFIESTLCTSFFWFVCLFLFAHQFLFCFGLLFFFVLLLWWSHFHLLQGVMSWLIREGTDRGLKLCLFSQWGMMWRMF